MTRAAHEGRLSGLTFALGLGALGVGFAIATGTAATAWASPADARSDTAAGRQVDSASGRPSAPAAARGAQARPGGRSAAASTPARPAAATKVSRQSGAAPRPTAEPRVLPSAPAEQTEPVAAQQAATTNWRPRLGRVSVPLDQRQTTYTILPYLPPGLPLVTVPWVKQVNGFGSFTTASIYDLKNEDQFDWNKLTGISFTIPGDVNSSMVAWRYNVTDQVFEVAPFFNVNKARILPNEQTEVITVPIGDTYDFNVDYDGITISYGDQTVFKPTPVDLKPNFWTSYRVSVWFGGTSLPPKLIQLRMRLN